jgi:PAS domain S-box-containing protein
MMEFLKRLFSSDFMPHGYCYLWKPDLVSLHAISDGTIALAYYLIPVALVYFVRKRKDLPFNWIFLMFGIFIFGCGTTHLMEVWTLWHGTYWLAGAIKAITAVASVATAAVLVPLIPKALALPSPQQLKLANLQLEQEANERRRAEAGLLKAHAELETRVRERTAELAAANQQLHVEIGERKRAEEVLRKQASLLDLAHDAILVCDMNGDIAFWNPGAEETYGWPGQEALGKAGHELLGSEYAGGLESPMKIVVRDARWEGELVQTRRDGRRIAVASRWALQRDEGGNPTAILQINTDVTERRRAEQNLRRSEAFLAEGQRLSHTGSWGWDVSSGALIFSRETFYILGFDPEQPAPTFQTAMDRFHPEDRASVDRILETAIRERKNYEIHARLALPDGSIKHVHCVGHAATTQSGALECIGTLIDITDRKLAEQELQVAQAELAHMARVTTMGELAASIAHEVNQPLSAVVNYASAGLRWLNAAAPNLDGAREAVTRIVKEGNRAAEVIGRIRSLIKKSPSQMSALDMNELINGVLVLTHHEVLKRGVSLRTELAADLPQIMGDRVQFQQVILNLLLNAIEATSEMSEGPRELLLTSQAQRPDEILIAVRDSGVGIDPGKAEQIFNPFVTTKGGGMGMGLPISRSIIERHGGRLWARANEGLGATFQFSVPVGSSA